MYFEFLIAIFAIKFKKGILIQLDFILCLTQQVMIHFLQL